MKPSIPKGTRDFTPDQVVKRNFIFETIREIFIRYGYQPIETPVMENLSTLTGKYGEEGDRLLFKVLNNGDFLAKADEKAMENRDSNALIPSIAKRGLRYDLTVPFARFVVMHQNEIAFPFKRYAIQPVWRADRPQKGRYQEFYQCDVDVVGSDSLMYDAELIKVYDEVFSRLGLPVIIKVNHRKVLMGLAEKAGVKELFMPMTVALDKLDKIGMQAVKNEMIESGIPASSADLIELTLAKADFNDCESAFVGADSGKEGCTAVKTVFDYVRAVALTNKIVFDPTLARGLSYYTGCIFEVVLDAEKHPEVKMGSLGGGGRYDDLTGTFGMTGMSGVGISFGAERIYDVMEELDLFPAKTKDSLQVLLIAFDDSTHKYAFRILAEIRKAGINADLYPEPVKLKKQMKYANDRQVPFVVLLGEDEMKNEKATIKDMRSGEQKQLELSEIIKLLSA